MKNIILLAAMALLIGCGGSNSNKSIEDMQNIIIVKNIPKGVCESYEYKVALEAIGFNDYKTKETKDNVSCEDYGHSTEDKNCAIMWYYPSSDDIINCVIGYTPSHEDLTKFPNAK